MNLPGSDSRLVGSVVEVRSVAVVERGASDSTCGSGCEHDAAASAIALAERSIRVRITILSQFCQELATHCRDPGPAHGEVCTRPGRARARGSGGGPVAGVLNIDI